MKTFMICMKCHNRAMRDVEKFDPWLEIFPSLDNPSSYAYEDCAACDGVGRIAIEYHFPTEHKSKS